MTTRNRERNATTDESNSTAVDEPDYLSRRRAFLFPFLSLSLVFCASRSFAPALPPGAAGADASVVTTAVAVVLLMPPPRSRAS